MKADIIELIARDICISEGHDPDAHDAIVKVYWHNYRRHAELVFTSIRGYLDENKV